MRVSGMGLWVGRLAYNVIGFHDQRLPIANFHSLRALDSVEPVGGCNVYLFLHAKITIGHRPECVRTREIVPGVGGTYRA